MSNDLTTGGFYSGWGNNGYYCTSCGMWVYGTHVCNTWTPITPNINVYPNTSTTMTYTWPPKEQALTDQEIDRVADRVIEKFKAELLGMMLEADPAAVTKLLLKAVSES